MEATMSLMIRRSLAPRSDLRSINQLLDATFNGWPFAPELSGTPAWIPPTDVFEDAEGVKIVVELPGLKPDEVKLTLENHTLTIRGVKQQVAEENATRVHRYERSYGSFERSFTLPDTADEDRIAAKFEHGVLTVTLPKAERAKAREISVKVG
jgi:HSP20 family protein